MSERSLLPVTSAGLMLANGGPPPPAMPRSVPVDPALPTYRPEAPPMNQREVDAFPRRGASTTVP